MCHYEAEQGIVEEKSPQRKNFLIQNWWWIILLIITLAIMVLDMIFGVHLDNPGMKGIG